MVRKRYAKWYGVTIARRALDPHADVAGLLARHDAKRDTESGTIFWAPSATAARRLAWDLQREAINWREIGQEKPDRFVHVVAPPSRSNPARRRRGRAARAAKQVLGIGLLVSLEVLDPKTRDVRSVGFRNRWLAWDPGRRRFLLVRVARMANARAVGAIDRLHRQFHDAASQRMVEVEAPEPRGRLEDVGLVKALTYKVPRQITSPEKNKYLWHHAFGDTGHKGGDSYPDRVMPALKRDADGNLFVVRRPGNIFRVDQWLRG